MADGTSLQFSANSGNSNFYLYNSNDALTAPPAAGQVRYNNAQQSLATIVYINHLTSDAIDVEIFFNQLSSLNELYVQDRNSSINFIKYNITGTPTVFVNSYVSIPVIQSSFGGTGETSFGANHPALISFFTNTLEVDTRISTLETKTINQTAIAGTTDFNGVVNFNAGFSNQRLKIRYGTNINAIDSLTAAGFATLDLNAVRVQVNGDLATTSNVQLQGTGSVQIQNDGSCQIQPTGTLSLKAFTCTGDISMSNTKITNLATPTVDADAATKAYADTAALNAFRWSTSTYRSRQRRLCSQPLDICLRMD
jgi:hypothetical protein